MGRLTAAPEFDFLLLGRQKNTASCLYVSALKMLAREFAMENSAGHNFVRETENMT